MPNLEDLPPDVVADAVARAVVAAVAGGGDREAIVARALGTVRNELRLHAGAAPAPATTSATGAMSATGATSATTSGTAWTSGVRNAARSNGAPSPGRQVVTEDDVRAAVAAGGSELRVSPRAIVTALARDAARDAGLQLVETPEGA